MAKELLTDWHTIESAPNKVEVMTRIHDVDGIRNQTSLERRGNLWWFPDGSMYVYYTPTHWRHL